MCKFCEGKELIWDGSTWKISINNYKELEIICDSVNYEYLNMEINYCPMCGKELVISIYT